jgi:hypothetical protein
MIKKYYRDIWYVKKWEILVMGRIICM